MKILLICLMLPFIGTAQIELVKTTLLNGKVELLVPKQLTEMTDETFKIKYRQPVKPKLVLTDENAEVNLIANITPVALQENQLEYYTDMHMANLQKTRADIKILAKGVKKINGKNIGYCKFSSQGTDQPIFNYYFFASIDGKLLFFTFNCVQKLQGTWEKCADQIVESIKAI